MPEIEIPESFLVNFDKLPMNIQRKVLKTIRILAENPRHPGLHSKPIEGALGVYEARVDLDYRLTYERLTGDVLRLRVVGKHDEVLKRP